MSNMMPLVTPKECAKTLGLKEHVVRSEIRAGRLPARAHRHQSGRVSYRIEVADLNAYGRQMSATEYAAVEEALRVDPTRLSDVPVEPGVYFVQCGPFVKIGMARDVRSRLLALQLGNPFPLRFLGAIGDGQSLGSLEAQCHARFAKFHRRGEWFWLEGELKAFCEALERERVGA